MFFYILCAIRGINARFSLFSSQQKFKPFNTCPNRHAVSDKACLNSEQKFNVLTKNDPLTHTIGKVGSNQTRLVGMIH